ncbi:MAG: ATP-binding protein [Lachnospiraceae bacterium]|nr:ATP-binding protein [Lachnospiraceae bacterium]
MKQRINLRLGLIALIAIVTTALGIILVSYNMFQNQVRRDLKQNARLLMETEVFQRAYNTGSSWDGQALEHLSSGTLRITWIDNDGTVLFDNDTNVAGLSNHLDRPEIRDALENGEGESTRRSNTMNMNTFYYALMLDNGTVLRVSTQANTIMSVLMKSLPVIISIAVIILLGCILIGHFLTRLLMRPITDMVEHLDDTTYEPAYKELRPFADKIRSQHEHVLAAAKSRQDFTANVSHELKTPITAISGYAELIENRLLDPDSEAHIAGQIRHNADRLLSLVTDIIQLSELDHRELPRRFESLDLYRIAGICLEDNKALAEPRGIKLSLSGISAGITADQALIREMIDNLLQNAIRYNKDGGQVYVRVTIEDGHPVIAVSDTGIGISAEHQDRVFERFYRVDKSRSRETGGTGLGLAIVKHIADIHNAEITLESEIGRGTTITVRF